MRMSGASRVVFTGLPLTRDPQWQAQVTLITNFVTVQPYVTEKCGYLRDLREWHK